MKAAGFSANLFLVSGIVMAGSLPASTSPAATSAAPQSDRDIATLSGGCFWCMEADFEQAPGVLEVTSGYTGGTLDGPTYDAYAEMGHKEAIQVVYDPSVISYTQLLDYYWMSIDPTDARGQFCDRGKGFSSTIFVHGEEQRRQAEASKARLDASGLLDKKVVTTIVEAGKFFPAEEEHQNYYEHSPWTYKFYRFGCRRDHRLDELWADGVMHSESDDNVSEFRKPTDQELKETLTTLQYRVTQQGLTEPAFNNEYWDNTRDGIYVDVVSGEPLFSSLEKYKSGTGWPSFTKPLEPDNVVAREDERWISINPEIRSKRADSHLGHVFEDGPQPTGLRYCMNSAALRFIAKEDLETNGYGKYANLFE